MALTVYGKSRSDYIVTGFIASDILMDVWRNLSFSVVLWFDFYAD